jgi:hypothetical protein
MHSVSNFSYVSAGEIHFNFTNYHLNLSSPLLGWIFCFVPLHLHWQNSPFWATVFFRRFCQIASGFHFVGFLDNVFFFLTEWGSQLYVQTPTWSSKSQYLCPPVTAWPSYTPRHWVPVFFCLLQLSGLRWSQRNQLPLGCSLYFPIWKYNTLFNTFSRLTKIPRSYILTVSTEIYLRSHNDSQRSHSCCLSAFAF